MHPTTNQSSHPWRTIHSVLACLAILLWLPAGFFQPSLATNLIRSIAPPDKNIHKQRSIQATSPLPFTSTSLLPVFEDKQSYHDQSGLTEMSSFENIWIDFLKEEIARASWVSVEGGFSLPIIQQPKDKNTYVSTKRNLITQFNRPAQKGVTALLAHNFRSGREFYNLSIGQKITVFYGEDLAREYQVVSVNRFQKVNRSSGYSDLIDLETNVEYSSTDVYNRFYRGPHHVTFQTCLEGDGYLDWGLYFVVAIPIN